MELFYFKECDTFFLLEECLLYIIVICVCVCLLVHLCDLFTDDPSQRLCLHLYGAQTGCVPRPSETQYWLL